jgi:hypothetical protein
MACRPFTVGRCAQRVQFRQGPAGVAGFQDKERVVGVPGAGRLGDEQAELSRRQRGEQAFEIFPVARVERLQAGGLRRPALPARVPEPGSRIAGHEGGHGRALRQSVGQRHAHRLLPG